MALVPGPAFHVAGAPLPAALGASGATFGAAVTIGMAMWRFLRD
jgi:hypothetical protein